MDYKSTLNLPITDFPMKANLPKREPDFLATWNEQKIYEQLLQKNKDKPKFILHDGPPYANGHIHFGHILNKILKDIIIKYKNMAGFQSPYVPGWDCHGLPIELGAVKELQASEKDPQKLSDPIIRREACRQYAWQYVKDQREQFKRLGIFGDWEHPYVTLDNQYEADIAGEFLKLYKNGYVYRGKKPVYWCVSCRTALAEAEVEYEDISSASIYVRFKVKNPEVLGQTALKGRDLYFVIWTTTPWTLPANLALAVGNDFSYSFFEIDGAITIVATDLKEAFLKACQKTAGEDLLTLSGSDFKKIICEHPFMNRESPVLLGHHVTLESGTGVVHIAPGHGQEDYQIGQANNLETLCPVDAAGRFIEGSLQASPFDEIKKFEGVSIKEVNSQIVNFLHQQKFLLNQPGDLLQHSYPHCWRCKKPVIFRATEQWFCSLSHNDLRKKALKTINGEVKWIPAWGKDRIFGMIETRPDWCLSRQRIWGVPIIVHHCKKCGQSILNDEIGKHIIAIFAREGADAWWKTEEPLLPPNTKCVCGSAEFTKDSSILDVWFDSGVSHAAVLDKNPQLQNPADLYLEGSDQHRGWFHSSLLASVGTRGRAPYKTVLTHGFVVDGQGKKYSKSVKNYIPPDKVLKENGAEVLRLWVAAEDYRSDIRVSPEILSRLTEAYRKIRNTCRFILGNLYDYLPDQMGGQQSLSEIDRWALHHLQKLTQKVQAAYAEFNFHVIFHELNRYCTVDLSSLYLDVLKDRLYTSAPNDPGRRAAQWVLFQIASTITRLMAPILSFTAEEIWKHLPAFSGKTSSVHLADFPTPDPAFINETLAGRWENYLEIRDELLKVLEKARQNKIIGNALEAKLCIFATNEPKRLLDEIQASCRDLLQVSQIEDLLDPPDDTSPSERYSTLFIEVTHADGQKCERCWMWSTDGGQSTQHPTLCRRCAQVLKTTEKTG